MDIELCKGYKMVRSEFKHVVLTRESSQRAKILTINVGLY